MQPIMLYQNRQVVLIKFCHFRASILSNATVRLSALRAPPKLRRRFLRSRSQSTKSTFATVATIDFSSGSPINEVPFSNLPPEPMRWPLRTRVAFGEGSCATVCHCMPIFCFLAPAAPPSKADASVNAVWRANAEEWQSGAIFGVRFWLMSKS